MTVAFQLCFRVRH